MGKTPRLQAVTPRFENRQDALLIIANSLHRIFEQANESRPYLRDDADYQQLEARSFEAIYNPIDETALKQLFYAIQEFFRVYRKPANIVASLVPIGVRPKPLSAYLPNSFEQFEEQVTEGAAEEYFEEAKTCAAEAVIMGELDGGIKAVIPRFRLDVRRCVFEMVANANSEKDLNPAEEERFLNAAQIANELSLLNADPEIAEIVINTRGYVDSEYGVGEGRPMPHSGRADVSGATDAQIRFLKAVVDAKRRENPAEFRKRVAGRIARAVPYLRIVSPQGEGEDDDVDSIVDKVPDEIPADVLAEMEREDWA